VELSGRAVDDRERESGPVDEHLLAGPVGLPEHDVEVLLPAAIPLKEAAVLIPVGMIASILLPEHAERHALPAELTVNLLPHWLGSHTGLPRIRRIQPPF
jgi:hypothetical protein